MSSCYLGFAPLLETENDEINPYPLSSYSSVGTGLMQWILKYQGPRMKLRSQTVVIAVLQPLLID